jgi:hypothetical protein
MIKGQHVIALHSISDFLSVMAARVRHVYGQFDRAVLPAHTSSDQTKQAC